MVVLLNPVCNWLSEMLHVYRSDVRVAVLRRNDLQNTGIDPAIENRRIVWTFMFEAAGRKVACENSRLLLRSRPEWCFTAVFPG